MNPLMQSTRNQNMGNLSQLNNIIGILRSGNPEQIAMNLMQKNPQFKQFVESNRGKTPEQIAQENGIDFNQIRSLLK